MDARSEAMNRAKEQEAKLLALEAKGEAVVIDAEDDAAAAAEVLEAVVPPPEPPEAHGRGR